MRPRLLCASLMILALGLFLFAGWPLKAPVLVLFFAITASLVGSIGYFLLDVSMSLKAMRLDIEPHL